MGETYALACALVWAFAVIFFRKSGETVSPFSLNLFRVVVSSLLFALTMVILRRPILGQAPLEDYLILIASGVIAIAFSDTLFHMCLNRVGAGLNAIVSTLYSPFIILFAFLMLGEQLSWEQFLGMVLIMAGVVVTSATRLPVGMDRRNLVIGVLYGVGSMITLAFGIILAKPVLERSDVLWATTVRQLGSFVVLAPVALLLPGRQKRLAIFRPHAAWKFSVPGAFLGSYLALILWIGGMKYTTAANAGILNQTSTIYTLIFASIFLKEPFTRRKGLATFLALLGIVFVLQF
ncbi:MAG: DMT family transporter [Candidatus Krumholzibacteria bacterium]|nr:DMT family transporter [Candidatus Krumholzibacteria bacterium]